MTPSVEWFMQAALRATLLLSGVFLLWRLLPASRPALRRHVLLVIAAGLLVAPWLSGWWSVGTPPATGLSLQSPGHARPPAWSSLIIWLWLTGSGLAMLRLAAECLALHRIIRRARPWSGSPPLPGIAVLQSSAISGPCVAGGRKPVLLLPDNTPQWTPAQWRMVLAHERQHLHQQDLRLSWLPRFVHCFYWWHPLAHWLTRQFHAESEALCDHAVLARSGHSAREYIEFLLSLNAARMPAHAAGMALKSPLGKRIERLLPTPRHPFRQWAAASALVILTGIVILSFSLKTIQPAPAGGAPAGAISPAETLTENADVSEARLRLEANPFPEE